MWYLSEFLEQFFKDFLGRYVAYWALFVAI
jgi:hypothetical protein